MAVDSASFWLLNALAVVALAIAMARLPGQASPVLITEHSTPARSTMADHIRLGENRPPLFCSTTVANWFWIRRTFAPEMPHSPRAPPYWAIALVDTSIATAAATAILSISVSSTVRYDQQAEPVTGFSERGGPTPS